MSSETAVKPKSSLNPFHWIRLMYDWVLKWSEHRHALKALSFIAIIEAIFFPIPADILLITMGASKPKKALWYATVCTVSSVGGGLIGYYLGAVFWTATQDFFLTYVFSAEIFALVVEKFKENAFFSIFIASFTPIPFKVFTIAAGVATLSLPTFVAAALIGRAMRFYLVAGLLFIFGPSIRNLIEKHFEKMTILFTILLVGGFYIIKVALKN